MSRGGYGPAYSYYVASADFAAGVEVTISVAKPANRLTICAINDVLLSVANAAPIAALVPLSENSGWIFNMKAGSIVVIDADREISDWTFRNQNGAAAAAFTIVGELVTAF